MPFRHPSSFDFKINLLKPSTIRMKIRGERGHPYFKALELLKNSADSPFTNKTKLAQFTQPMVEFVASKGRPIWRTNLKKSQ